MDTGTWADWTIALVTLGGFIAAVLQLKANRDDSRAARQLARREEKENRKAMARAVGLKSEWHPDSNGRSPAGDGRISVTVEIMNSSPYPIRNAVLELATDDDLIPMQIVYGTILPGDRIKDSHLVSRTEVTFGELSGGATLTFTDTFDDHWSTSTSWQGLERVETPPTIC